MHTLFIRKPTVKDGERTGNGLACVASVSVWFRSEERPRNGMFGLSRPRNGTGAIFRAVFDSCSRSLLRNHTETLATQDSNGSVQVTDLSRPIY